MNSLKRYAAPLLVIFMFVVATATVFVGQAADTPRSTDNAPVLSDLIVNTPGDVAPLPELGPVAPALLDPLKGYLQSQAVNHPIWITVFLVIGCLRFFLKPAVAAAHWYAEQTATKKDDELIAKIENSVALKLAFFCFDWFASLKPRR